MEGFRKFILRGNVVDLAIAVVIGGAFGTVITALVKDIITPIFGALGGLPDFANWVFTVNGSKFLIGDFINALITFVLIAAVLYFLIVLPMNRLNELRKPAAAPAPATTKECPECLSKIPTNARRCAFCTAVLNTA